MADPRVEKFLKGYHERTAELEKQIGNAPAEETKSLRERLSKGEPPKGPRAQ